MVPLILLFQMFMQKTSINELYNKTDVLFIGKTEGPSNPEWREIDIKLMD